MGTSRARAERPGAQHPSVGPEPGGSGGHLVDALGRARFVLVHEVGHVVGLGTVIARLRSDNTHPGDVGDVIH